MEDFFHIKIARDTYLISDPSQGPNDDGKSALPGTATANSYLLVGGDEALLIDLAVNRKGLVRYAESIAQKPVKVVLSHAHIDHIFYIKQCGEVWLHKDDEQLLRKGKIPFQMPVFRCPVLHFIKNGDSLDIGGRQLQVIHMPGHTDGSILLYDSSTKILFSGDTVARRLLYGLHTRIPVEDFVAQLKELKKLDFEKIYSAHDRCALSKDNIDLMISVMCGSGSYTEKVEKIPVLGEMTTREAGTESSLLYFSFAF